MLLGNIATDGSRRRTFSAAPLGQLKSSLAVGRTKKIKDLHSMRNMPVNDRLECVAYSAAFGNLFAMNELPNFGLTHGIADFSTMVVDEGEPTFPIERVPTGGPSEVKHGDSLNVNQSGPQ